VVVNLMLCRFAEWLERRLVSRVRTRVAAGDDARDPDAPADDTAPHAPRTMV